jgi:ABC-type thiamine transport system ATPase subunit
LSRNGLGYNKSGAELAEAFKGIPASVTSLDLSRNGLQKLSVEEINKLSDSFAKVQTIALSVKEINAMTKEQRVALKSVFLNIQNVVLLDDEGNALGGDDPKARHYFASKLGLTKDAPTLKAITAFFVKHDDKLSKDIPILPEELKKFTGKF